MRAVFLILLGCIACMAQENSTEATLPPEAALIAQVQQEQMISRQWIDTMIKLQHSSMSIQAAQYLLQSLQNGGVETGPNSPSTGHGGHAYEDTSDSFDDSSDEFDDSSDEFYTRESFGRLRHPEDAAPYPMFNDHTYDFIREGPKYVYEDSDEFDDSSDEFYTRESFGRLHHPEDAAPYPMFNDHTYDFIHHDGPKYVDEDSDEFDDSSDEFYTRESLRARESLFDDSSDTFDDSSDEFYTRDSFYGRRHPEDAAPYPLFNDHTYDFIHHINPKHVYEDMSDSSDEFTAISAYRNLADSDEESTAFEYTDDSSDFGAFDDTETEYFTGTQAEYEAFLARRRENDRGSFPYFTKQTYDALSARSTEDSSDWDSFLEVGENVYGYPGYQQQYPGYQQQYPGYQQQYPSYQQQYPSYQQQYPSYQQQYPGYESMYNAAPQQPQLSASNQRLLFAYNMYYAIKMKMYQTIFKSADVQNEFWQDRAMQLYVQSAGDAVDPNILQLLFVKMYRTNLETLKLSLSFQYINHFVTWLEDELDVYGSVSEGADIVQVSAVVVDQEDDLIRDRMFAFSAYNSFAQLDFQTFYFDLYLESVLGGGSLGGPSMGSSFLEESEEAKPFTDILATGSFGAGVGSQPYLFLKVYRFYYLLFQMYTAHAGLAAASAHTNSYNMAHDNIATNDQFGQQLGDLGTNQMQSYATNLMYASQMEYISSLFELYILAAPIVGGSLGGSLGSLGGSLGSLGGSLGSMGSV